MYCEECKIKYIQVGTNDMINNNEPTICGNCGSTDIFVTTETTKWCIEHGCWETSAEHARKQGS